MRKYIDEIVHLIETQSNKSDSVTIIRLEGFENPIIYKEVCKYFKSNSKIEINAKLAKEKYNEYKEANNNNWIQSIKFLEEKNVPINIQKQGDSEDIKSYEVNPKEVILKGKKEILDKITYIKTEKIDLSTIGVSKKINLIIPEGVTLEQTSITIKPKDKESLIQRIIYNKDEVELINNSNDIKETDLNIPDSINVEVQLEDSDTTISKSDISLYIDLENGYDEDKEYTINYKSDLEFKNIKIIPSTVGR